MLANMKVLATSLVLCFAVAAYGYVKPQRQQLHYNFVNVGFPEGQVVGGKNAPLGMFPYQVSLKEWGSHFCGGSIISSRYILTAAHCVDGLTNLTSISVHVGTTLQNASGVVYGVEKIVMHRGFNDPNIINDVALIRVDKDIAFNNLIKPIALAAGSKTYEGSSCVLSGWGSIYMGSATPNNLQYVNLRVQTQEKCKEFFPRISSSHICTYTKPGEGACNGDSGGPLVANGLQIGIVSFGSPCAVGEPDVYTRVSSFVSWINAHQANLMNENAEEPIDAIYIV